MGTVTQRIIAYISIELAVRHFLLIGLFISYVCFEYFRNEKVRCMTGVYTGRCKATGYPMRTSAYVQYYCIRCLDTCLT